MKNKKVMPIVAVSMIISLLSLSLNGCANPNPESEGKVLKIYNWEDYIYEPDSESDEEQDASIVDQFKAFYLENYGEEVEIVYDTFDTNETMYNQIKNLGADYDLACPSDYMIQKMINEDLLEEFDYDNVTNTYDSIANYNDYASTYLKNIFVENEWSKYALGYMWGTMGLVYNPENVAEADMSTWGSLWEEQYLNKILVKDSMRDTYFVGIMKVYKTELDQAKQDYTNSVITKEQYNATITEIFNRCDDDTLTAVEAALKELKTNIYGLEVDSGKNDIAKGTVDIQLAWSGDAVYSMDVAEEEFDTQLNYSIPEEGSNIWFDGWVMPKGADTELAQLFLNFISNPEIAALNMDYIGYTSFIAGDTILDYVISSYGVEDGEYSVDLSYFFEGTLSEGVSAIVTTDTIGRQFSAQYPDSETISRCAVMMDFGTQNNAVIDMWARFKSTEISTITYVIIGIILVGLIALLVNYLIKKKNSKRHLRKKIKQASKNA